MCALLETEIFVGRYREMALLRQRLEQLAAGTPLVASIVGEAGIGKTTLCSRVMAEAADLDVRGVRATAVEGDGSPSYWLWVQVLRQLGIDGEIDFEPVSSVMVDPLSRRQLEFSFFEKVSERVRALADEQPLLFVFEDLHWTDDESLRLLSHIVSDLEGSPVGVITTYRDPMGGSLSTTARQAFINMSRTAGFESLELEPFSEVETDEAIQMIVGDSGRSISSRDVFARSGGNPLFVSELAHVKNGDDSGALSSTVQLAVGARLGSLDDRTVEFLEICSLAQGGIRSSVVQRVAGSWSSAEVLSGVDEGIAHRFLVTDAAAAASSGDGASWRFRHPVVREVVASGIAPVRRVRLHARYMEALEVEYRNVLPERAEEMVFHAERARTLIDDARLVRYLLFAARLAMKSLSFERAAARYTRVIELAESEVVDDSLAEAMRGIVVAGSGAGRDEEIAGYFARAFLYYVSNGMIDKALEIAQIRFIDGPGMRAGLEVCEAALELVEPGTVIEASILGRLGRAVGMVSGDYSRAKGLLDRGIGIARSLGDSNLEMQLCGDGINVAGFASEFAASREFCERVVELAEVTSDPLSESGAYLHLGMSLFATGDTLLGFEYFQKSLQRSIESRINERVSSSHKVLISAYIRVCDWRLAGEHVQQALDLYASDARVLAQKASVEAMTGDADDFDSTLKRYLEVPESVRDSGEGPFRYLQMAYRAEQGELLLGELLRSVKAVESRLETTQIMSGAVFLTKACLALEGGSGDFGVLRERLMGSGLPDLERSYLPGITSLAGLVDEADDDFQRMIAGAAESGQLFNEVWLRFDFAAHLIRHGRGETAIARTIAEGRRAAERAGIPGLQEKYDLLELSNVARKKRTAGLTKRELEILRLMYLGMSNPQIAGELVVSRHTVVRHLSNVFTKLGVSNRAEAGRTAVELGLVSRGDVS
jgi:DNA-binding CsgD family transcriptional regulator